MDNIKNAAIYLVAGLIFVVGGAYISNSLNKEDPKPEPVTRLIVDCPSDYASYEKITKRLKVVEDIPSFGNSDGSFVGKIVSIKRTGLNSQIACGYLFYRVSAGDSPIEERYMNLYMGTVDSRGGVQFGGHIIPDKNIEIINKDVDGKTEVLLPLDKITYDGTDRKNIKQVNWVSLLNISDFIDFKVALNTVKKAEGKVNLVEIAYKCWNPKTGEETEDCNLELVK